MYSAALGGTEPCITHQIKTTSFCVQIFSYCQSSPPVVKSHIEMSSFDHKLLFFFLLQSLPILPYIFWVLIRLNTYTLKLQLSGKLDILSYNPVISYVVRLLSIETFLWK